MLRVLGTGYPSVLDELKGKLANVDIDWTTLDALENCEPASLSYFDWVICTNILYKQHELELIANETQVHFMLNSVVTPLYQLFGKSVLSLPHVMGCNLLATFIQRPIWEAAFYHSDIVSDIENQLNINIEKVEDRAGMVAPRIVGMIINEAYFTLQEGTATKPDIDQAMKLGTNYPHGPFEWSIKIGLDNVVAVLEATRAETQDERYKICPLLKKEALFM